MFRFRLVSISGIVIGGMCLAESGFLLAAGKELNKKTSSISVAKMPKTFGVSLRNPFLSAQEEKLYGSARGKILVKGNLELTAVFYFPGRSQAIVNGQIVKEGDYIEGKKIIKIERESLILKDIEGEYILRLRTVATTKSDGRE